MRVDAFSLSCNRTENMRALRWLVYLFCFIGVKMVDINKKVCIRGKAEQTMKAPRALSIRFTQVPTAPPQVFQVLWFHVIPPKKKNAKAEPLAHLQALKFHEIPPKTVQKLNPISEKPRKNRHVTQIEDNRGRKKLLWKMEMSVDSKSVII